MGLSSERVVIDCDADPDIPEGWTVVFHKKGGQFVFDPTKIELYLSEKQKNGGNSDSYELHDELANKATLNANVLHYLWAHPEYIPEEWKGKNVLFHGTIYRHSNGDLYVGFLSFGGNRWNVGYYGLVNSLTSRSPSALRMD